MKTLTCSFLTLSLIWAVSCKHTAPDSITPVIEKPAITAWTNIDSLVGLTDHTALGIYADSSGIIFMNQQGFTFLAKGSKAPVRYGYPLYNSYWSGINPTFFKGMAYVITSENTIDVFPYGNPSTNTFSIRLSDLNVPVTPTGRIEFSLYAPITISSKNQMVVQLDAGSAPQYLLTLQLDAAGKPMRNADGTKVGKLVALRDSTFIGNFYNHYAEDDQLFVSVARNYKKDNLIVNTLQGELQRVTPAGTFETVLPLVVTENLINFKSALYAVAYSPDVHYSIYKSTDTGKNWLPLYELNNYYLADFFSHFYTIDNRLTVAYLHNYLQEFDIEKNQTKTLSLAGLPDTRGNISGLAEYEGYVYLTTLNGGIYRKTVKDFWQYEMK